MKSRLLTACVVIGSMLAPLAAYSAEDADHDRSHPKQWVKDSAITTQIKTKMATDRQVSAMHIKVDTDKNGVVVLSGTAKSQAEIDKAHKIAHSVEGVTKVINHIKIKKDY